MNRTVLFFVLAAPLFFTGCTGECGSECASGNGGENLDGDGSCDNCQDTADDTGGNDEMGTLLVEAYGPSGELEQCTVVIDGKAVGNTSTTIPLEPDKYTFGLGDAANTVDGIPLHTSTSLSGDWNGTTWIAALTKVTIDPSTPVAFNDHGSTETPDDDPRQLNYYAKTVNPIWTCIENDGTPHPGELVYTDGAIVDFPGIGKMVLTGTEFVDLEFDGQYYSGEFDTPTTAWLVKDVEGDEYDASYSCWAGNENQKPMEEEA